MATSCGGARIVGCLGTQANGALHEAGLRSCRLNEICRELHYVYASWLTSFSKLSASYTSPFRTAQTAAWVRSLTAILRRMFCTCSLTVSTLISSERPISLIAQAQGHVPQDLRLALRQGHVVVVDHLADLHRRLRSSSARRCGWAIRPLAAAAIVAMMSSREEPFST